MAVCRLAIISYRDGVDYGGYDNGDLLDCIAFAEYEVELGILTGFDGQSWKGFIQWAKRKLELTPPTKNKVREGRMSKQTISKETARRVIEFFKLYPQKDCCLADSTEGKEMVYWRKDIPWLELLQA